MTTKGMEEPTLLKAVELGAAPHAAQDRATGRAAAACATKPGGSIGGALERTEGRRVAARGQDADREDLATVSLFEFAWNLQ